MGEGRGGWAPQQSTVTLEGVMAKPVGTADLRPCCVCRSFSRDGREGPGRAPGLGLQWDTGGFSVPSVGVDLIHPF